MSDRRDATADTGLASGLAHRSTLLPASPLAAALAPALVSPELQRARASARARLLGTPAPAPMRVDRFLIVRRLGAGGMGVVYAAYDPELDRKVAVKLLRPGTDGPRNEQLRLRLLREAQAMAKVTHPHVVTVHEVGTFEGQVFIAMEFVDGTTLRQWLERGQRSWTEIRDVFVAVGRGLAAAHAAGLVHRDFKPDNVMIAEATPTSARRVIVLDFGLATQRGTEESLASEPHVVAHAPGDRMTETGAVLGTPAYMSPEQLRSARVDARADQFSFCVALFEAVYGRRPFAGATFNELALAVAAGRIDAPEHRGDVPPAVYRAMLRGLATDPDARFPAMDGLLAELERQRWSSQRRIATFLGATVVVAAAVFAVDRLAEDPACDETAGLLARAWDDGLRQRGRAAFVATEKPYAAEAWGTALRVLDEQAQAWQSVHAEVCGSAPPPEPERLARLLCLEWRAQELGALAELFAQADGDVVDRAIEASEDLTPARSCTSDHALRTAARTPDDPALRRALFDARGRLAQAKGLGDAGKLDAALGIVDRLREAEITRTHPPIVAEIELRRGHLRRQGGDLVGAEQSLAAAVYAGLSDDGDDIALAAATELVWLLGSDRSAFDGALPWMRIGEALAHRLDDDVAGSELLVATGAMFAAAGRNNEARTAYEQAIARAESGAGQSSLEPYLRFAAFAVGHGEPARALETAESALHVATTRFGEEHPTTASVYVALAELEWTLGRYADARVHAERALVLEERARGSEHPATAPPLLVLARTAWAEHRLDDALAALDRIDVVRAGGRLDDVTLVGALTLRAWLSTLRGRPGEADATIDRALAVARRRGGSHPLHWWPLAARAEVRLATDRPAEALRALEQARASLGASVGDEDPLRQFLAVAVARALLAQGERARALGVLDRADATLRACCEGHMLFEQIAAARASTR